MNKVQLTIWDVMAEIKAISDARNERIDKNQKLVWKVVNDMEKKGWFSAYRKTFDKDDLFQIGCIGLIKASDKYNPEKAEFSTYAYRTIYNTLYNALRDNSLNSKGFKTSHDSMNVTLEDYIPAQNSVEDSEEIRSLDMHNIFAGIIKANPTKEKFVREMEVYLTDYGKGYTFAEVAKKHNIKKSQLDSKLTRFRKMAKEAAVH